MDKKLNRKIIIILGPPGAGKGTQAALIAEKLGLYHFETSRLIKQRLEIGDPDPKINIEEEKKIHYSGKLNTPWIVAKWVREKIEELYQDKENNGIVFDGSPRTFEEAEKIKGFLKNTYGLKNVTVFFIKLSEEEIKFRLSHRLICSACGKTASLLLNKDIEKCQKCGGKLIKRDLDDPKIVPTRLKEYYERTKPAIDYLKTNFHFVEIGGSGSIKEVNRQMINHLKKCEI